MHRAIVSASLLLSLAVLASCTRAPLPTPEQVIHISDPMPVLTDELPVEPLLIGLAEQIAALERQPTDIPLSFGSVEIPRPEYITALRNLLLHLKDEPENLQQYLDENFVYAPVYGRNRQGEVLLTSYYEPVIRGSLRQTEEFSRPLYRRPPDLIRLPINEFLPDVTPQRALRGRIVGSSLVPYYSRSQIDGDGKLNGRGLEIVWVDPVEAFFLHIQGSGTVQLPNGREVFINFADKNGEPYRAIGAVVRKAIAPAPVTLQSIKRYLRTLSPAERDEILFKNKSYIFFDIGKRRAITALGVPAIPGRTIATDRKFFPKGGIAVLEFNSPEVVDGLITSETPVTRLVLDQDVGGAITGPGRVDLFWGRGPEAREYAGVINSSARLGFLIPRRQTSR